MMKAKQKGNALLLAMLLVTVCVIIVIAIIDDQSIHLLRTQSLLNQAQMEGNAKGVQIWASNFLRSDFYTQDAKQHQLASWPKTLHFTANDGTQIQGELFDAQSFYNLNDLSDIENQTGLLNLLQTLLPDLAQQNKEDIIRATIAWISPPGKNSDVASESFYLNAKPPYLSAHQFFISPSEWRYIKGVTPTIYLSAAPYLIALPKVTPVNINTASAIVLTSLSAKMSLDQARAIITLRNEQGGFLKTDDFLIALADKGISISPSLITTQSEYFLLRTDIEYQHRHLIMFNLYNRFSKNNKIFDVKLLWTSIGML